MNFQPKSEKEIADSELLAKGEYEFQIIDAKEQKSQAGNEMIVLRVKILANGRSRVLTDYLLEQRIGKLRSCCLACDIYDKYLNGRISADDFFGKRGRLKLRIEAANDDYPARNVIVGYL